MGERHFLRALFMWTILQQMRQTDVTILLSAILQNQFMKKNKNKNDQIVAGGYKASLVLESVCFTTPSEVLPCGSMGQEAG